MAGAGPATKAIKPPDGQSYAKIRKRMKSSLLMGSYKVMQVVVGTGFLVVLQALAFMAWVQRLCWTPEALKKSQRFDQQPTQLMETTFALTPAAADDVSDVKDSTKAQIVIRAIAAIPTSLQPVMLHNDPDKGGPTSVRSTMPCQPARAV